MKQATIERVENGYIVHIFTTRDGVDNKHFIASSEYEVGEIIKRHLKDDKKKEK
jgi:hypothetical protein